MGEEQRNSVASSSAGRNWSIRFRANGKVFVEAVGPSRAMARDVLEKRRNQAREGKFFPDLIERNVWFKEIIEDAVARVKDVYAVKHPNRSLT
jgi:hypothetical protein